MKPYQAPKLAVILRVVGGLCLMAPLVFYLVENRHYNSFRDTLLIAGIGLWTGLINFGLAQILIYTHRTATVTEAGGGQMPDPPPIDTVVRGAMNVPPPPSKPSVIVPPPPPIEDGNP